MTFRNLGLIQPIVRAVEREGYTTPTPIQCKAIPVALAGSDVLACARTGTGKTAAFALPILHRLVAGGNRSNGEGRTQKSRSRQPRALILAPTRELASQIGDSFRAYGHGLSIKHVAIFGGVNQNPQVRSLKVGVDIIVATPGRLMDLIQQRHVDLRGIEIFVLDEADRMLDMGFMPDIRKIITLLPEKRQTMLFSATMPREIRVLADTILREPADVQVDPVSSAANSITQSVYHVPKKSKPALLRSILSGEASGRTLVFTRTKHGADRLVKDLLKGGFAAAAIHGNNTQNARTRALSAFKSRTPPVLVATDIASRGIDVDDITHVINFDMPVDAETYVHRIGRTARAGASGAAVSFCDPDERGLLWAVERLIRTKLTVRTDQPEFSDERSLPESNETKPSLRESGEARPKSHRGGGGGSKRRRSHDRSGAPAGRMRRPSRGTKRPKAHAASRS